ncbi:MAG: hypothetical protein ABJB86_15795 [Bacteroidota bacterium]
MKCAYYGCLVIVQLICCSLHCQYYFSANNKTEPELLWELGASAGAMNCLTDIGGATGKGKKFVKDINWNQAQFGGSIFVSAAWHDQFAIRLQGSMGRIAGNDQVLKNSSGVARNRYLRNLQFRTNIKELAITGEIYPLLILNSRRGPSLLSPYIAGGAGFFNYTPQAWINNTWIDLRPLHTEGEGFKEYPDRHTYSSTTWCIPVGAGIKYDAAGLINLRFEILYRITGTDYLDDVSSRYVDPALFSKYLTVAQSKLAATLADRSAEITPGAKNNMNDIRGNANNKDAYFSFMLAASISLGRVQRK